MWFCVLCWSAEVSVPRVARDVCGALITCQSCQRMLVHIEHPRRVIMPWQRFMAVAVPADTHPWRQVPRKCLCTTGLCPWMGAVQQVCITGDLLASKTPPSSTSLSRRAPKGKDKRAACKEGAQT